MTTNDTQGWEPSEYLKEYRKRRDALIKEIERQSDAGAINLDELITLYHREYDQPVWMLAQDIQTQVSVYDNVFETLKQTKHENAAQNLKKRYVDLGLIPESNQWPNPVRDWLMNHALSKISQYRKALLDIVRTHGRQLIRELNFEPTLALGFQISVGTNTSFAITVQAEVTAVHRA